MKIKDVKILKDEKYYHHTRYPELYKYTEQQLFYKSFTDWSTYFNTAKQGVAYFVNRDDDFVSETEIVLDSYDDDLQMVCSIITCSTFKASSRMEEVGYSCRAKSIEELVQKLKNISLREICSSYSKQSKFTCEVNNNCLQVIDKKKNKIYDIITASQLQRAISKLLQDISKGYKQIRSKYLLTYNYNMKPLNI